MAVAGWLGVYQDNSEEVVEDAIVKVEQLLKAPSHGFMKQIAKVESDYGRHPNTFRPGRSCGIWQVDPIGLEDTKDVKSHPQLKWRLEVIETYLGIEWEDVTCDDLGYPVLGAIAARLYLLNIPGAIPEDIEGRARYWKDNYNSAAGAGSVEYFINKVRSHE